MYKCICVLHLVFNFDLKHEIETEIQKCFDCYCSPVADRIDEIEAAVDSTVDDVSPIQTTFVF